jgi:outer membrane protein
MTAQMKLRIVLACLCFTAVSEHTLYGQGQAGPPAENNKVTLLESVRSALENHPLLQSQQAQVEINRGLREQASGAFDRISQTSVSNDLQTTPLTAGQQLTNREAGLLGTSQKTHNTSFGFSLDQPLRNGMELTGGIQTGRSVDNLFTATGVNSSTMSLSLRIPLLKGRGRRVAAASEEAAKREVDAASFDLQQLAAQLTSNVATSYWSLVAARRSVAIAIDAEQRGRTYLDDVQQLVKADRAPANDLNEVVANLAQRTSSRISAEQQLVSARQQLALDMGTNLDDLVRQRLEPTDSLPDGEGQALPSDSADSIRYYVEQALLHRADFRASLVRVEGQGILFQAARNRLLPQLDLNAFGGYSGLQEGRNVGSFYSDAFQGIRGPTAGLGLTYSFPHRNQAARGALRQAQGANRQAELQNSELERNIGSSVVVAVEAVRSAIVRLKQARAAVRSFESALTGERDKYSGGIGSIVEILTVEDKLNSALSDEVQAELTYALAVVQFRFATGTLLPAGGATQTLSYENFVSAPFRSATQDKQ